MENNGHEPTVCQLVRLSQVEYETDPNQPDLIGWSVVDAEGEEVGTLHDMLADIDTGEILFAIVNYAERCIAVPLELMFLDEDNHRLVIPVEKETINCAPEFNDNTEDLETHVDFWNQQITECHEED